MVQADKKTVLVAGGGFAGLATARALAKEKEFAVIVIDPKSFFEFVPGSPASFVDASSAAKSLGDYSTTAGVTHQQGILTAVATDGTRGTATLQGGEQLAFDYLLVATGSTYPAGVKPDVTHLTDKAARLQQLAGVRAQVEAAETIVVVGGGSVGVEIAAEVAERHPSKKVTLVCSGALLARMDAKAQAFAADWLQKHGVEVLTGERISDWGGLGDGLPTPATLTTASGRTLEGDLVFKCVGVRPATAAFAASLGADQLAADGSVAVEPTLQVVGWRNVFSVGDVSNVREEKTAALAGLAAGVAAQNIVLLDQGQPLQQYPECLFGGAAPMAGGFTLGPKSGVMQMGGDVQAGAAPATIKAVFKWLYMRMVAGSRVWSWLYFSVLQKQLVGTLAKEARKAEAAGQGKLAPAAA